MQKIERSKEMFREYLENQVLPVQAFKLPFPTAQDTEGWENIRSEDRQGLEKAIRAVQDTPYPMLPASAFMAFARSGDRQAFEKPYFFRRKKLILSALAYCLTPTGPQSRELQDVIDGLWCICEETSWVLSAHNIDSHKGSPRPSEKPLPDYRSPVIDLFAAQSGMILSLVLALTGKALDEVTPLVRRRVEHEIEVRLLTPFEIRDDAWWMGFLRSDLNNWTPWIISNMLIITALQVKDTERARAILARALIMTDRWLDVVPEDGGCDEGVAYWNMAGGAFLDILQLTDALTGRAIAWRDSDRVRKILSYPYSMWLGGEWFANFADCDAKPYLCGERLVAAGLEMGDSSLAAFGARFAGDICRDLSDTPQFWRLLLRLFMKMPECQVAEVQRDVWLEKLQVRGKTRGKISLYMKGGNNGENHNHNDVGSFILFCDGQCVVADIGNLVYTAKTFSDKRYEIWNTRSANHNVPLIGTYEQAPGAEHAARLLSADPFLSLDIAGAYPGQAGVLEAVRNMTISDDGKVKLEDRIRLSYAQTVTEVFILRNRPERLEDGWDLGAGVQMYYGGDLAWEITELPVHDARLEKSYPGSLWRLAVTGRQGVEHRYAFVFEHTTEGPALA